MDHHHPEHGSGSAEKKVKINNFSSFKYFFITIVPPAVFYQFFLEKSHLLVTGGDDYASNHTHGA
jgi:hypothetical protein